jgi:hypothetical protein
VTLVLSLVPVALAGGGGGNNPMSTLALASDSVAAWTSFHASGCGYTVGKQANIGVDSPYWLAGFAVPVDESGCVNFMFWVDGPGAYTIRTYQNLKGNKQTLVASTSLTVY